MIKKSRTLMFVQQLEHLKVSIDDFPEILNQSGATEWAFIIHNKDEGAKPHVHCVLHFKNAHHASAIAKLFNDTENSVEYWNSRIGNAYSYLIHQTQDAHHSKKHLYSAKDVTANFDFEQKIKSISQQVNSKQVKQYIVDYSEGNLTFKQLQNKIGVYNMAINSKIIDNITRYLAEVNHQKWLQEFEGPMQVIWLWGPSGIGKSVYADYLVSKKGSVAKLGASNDYFQGYNQEHVCILNDVRPNDFKWSDLLRMLDNWQLDKQAPRRYKNCYLDVETIVITTPFDSYSFYAHTRYIDRKIDTYEQLQRRITCELGPDDIVPAIKRLHLGRYKEKENE